MEREEFIDLLLQLGFVESNLTGKTWPNFVTIGAFSICKKRSPLQMLVNYWRFNDEYLLVEHPTPFLIPEGIQCHLWENGVKEYLIKQLVFSESVQIQVRQPPLEEIFLYKTQFSLYKIKLTKEYPSDNNWENVYSYVKDFKSIAKGMIRSQLENVDYVNLNLLVQLIENLEITKCHNKVMEKIKQKNNLIT